MAGPSGFESVEHTADLALRAWAGTTRGLIEQCARGMLDMMLDDPPEAARFVEVSAEGATPEELIVDSLREILVLIELDESVPVSVEVLNVEADAAVCRVGVVTLDVGRSSLVQDIKAVTYHGLEVQRRDDSLEVEIVFDV
jgi:SHS2 domain-containing protein